MAPKRTAVDRFFNDGYLLLAIVIVICVVAGVLQGCGGALQTHARAATMTGVTLGAARDIISQARTHELEGCRTVACFDDAVRVWDPVIASYDTVRGALEIWVDAIEVAHLAGGDHDVTMSLIQMALNVVDHLSVLMHSLDRMGVHQLQVPPALDALFDAIRLMRGQNESR